MGSLSAQCLATPVEKPEQRPHVLHRVWPTLWRNQNRGFSQPCGKTRTVVSVSAQGLPNPVENPGEGAFMGAWGCGHGGTLMEVRSWWCAHVRSLLKGMRSRGCALMGDALLGCAHGDAPPGVRSWGCSHRGTLLGLRCALIGAFMDCVF
eukprot:gene19019-biopygen16018